jgi:hypothetical protein
MPDALSFETKMERYAVLLKSKACTPFYRQWINDRIAQLKETHCVSL